MKFFNDILNQLFERPWAKSLVDFGHDDTSTETLLNAVLNAEGDVSSHIYARQLLSRFAGMDDSEQLNFFDNLLAFDLDPEALISAASDYKSSQSAQDLAKINRHAEPRWQDLFRRLNAVADGTVALVQMRRKLLEMIKIRPELKRLDVGLKSLMLSWFNSGFLVLKPIDWSTSAQVLEKIIAYEAVHEITSWDDLRARLAPEDRRCFAFFHPAMPDEPLIFVEVALMTSTPSAISDVLITPRDVINQHEATTAVFYSISNCQQGLAGISFGNFLIKQVARELQRDLPKLTRFATLSPVPQFRTWLKEQDPALNQQMIASTSSSVQSDDEEGLAQKLCTAAAEYFMVSTRKDGKPNDPVARFHLGNGASLDRLNLNADLSDKGMTQSFGLMVNYLYELDAVEKNHDEYSNNNKVCASNDVKSLLKKAEKSKSSASS